MSSILNYSQEDHTKMRFEENKTVSRPSMSNDPIPLVPYRFEYDKQYFDPRQILLNSKLKEVSKHSIPFVHCAAILPRVLNLLRLCPTADSATGTGQLHVHHAGRHVDLESRPATIGCQSQRLQAHFHRSSRASPTQCHANELEQSFI